MKLYRPKGGRARLVVETAELLWLAGFTLAETVLYVGRNNAERELARVAWIRLETLTEIVTIRDRNPLDERKPRA